MAIADIRQRSGYLLLAIVVGHLILISAQVRSKSGVPLLESAAFGGFAGVQRVSWSAIHSVRNLWEGYVGLLGVRQENETLRKQVAALQVRLQEQRALAQEALRLRQVLELKTRAKLETRAAAIVAGSATPDFRVVTIDKGRADGLRPDMAVIAPDGVVGRVVMPVAGAAKVQLIIDRNAAAAAIIERSREQAIVMGTGDLVLRLEYLAPSADVKSGDVIVTSGIDGIYPKGFLLGRIEKIEKTGPSRTVWVKPAVDFSRLEEVLVVVAPPPAPPSKPEGTE